MTRLRPPRPIAADDPVDAFSCGDVALDDWLRQRAKRNEAHGSSRTFVTMTAEHDLAGYYCLAAAALPRTQAPGRVRRNAPDPIPAIVLGRLAVDERFQGATVGQNLLRDAIRRTLAAADVIGATVLLVHAANDRARAFYEHFGFESSPADAMQLMLPLRDARHNGFG